MQGVYVNGSEQLVQCHEGTYRKQASQDHRVERAPVGETRSAFSLRRMCTWGVMAGVGSLLTFSVSPASANPCQSHQGKAKKACVAQLERDRMAWPPRPAEWEIKRRVGAHWNKALRVAVCETGGNWQHYPHGTYVGGLGMYRGTYAYGQRVTGYRWPSDGATRAEQIAVAVASHPITHGWSGWGCGGA